MEGIYDKTPKRFYWQYREFFMDIKNINYQSNLK